MALKDEQLMAIQHVFWQGCVCIATDRYSQYTCINSYCSYSSLASTFSAGSALFIICKFSLCISMNYTENATELLVHVQAVDTRHSSLIFWVSGNKATEDLGKWIVHLHEVFEEKCLAVKAHWSWYFTSITFLNANLTPKGLALLLKTFFNPVQELWCE